MSRMDVGGIYATSTRPRRIGGWRGILGVTKYAVNVRDDDQEIAEEERKRDLRVVISKASSPKESEDNRTSKWPVILNASSSIEKKKTAWLMLTIKRRMLVEKQAIRTRWWVEGSLSCPSWRSLYLIRIRMYAGHRISQAVPMELAAHRW